MDVFVFIKYQKSKKNEKTKSPGNEVVVKNLNSILTNLEVLVISKITFLARRTQINERPLI